MTMAQSNAQWPEAQRAEAAPLAGARSLAARLAMVRSVRSTATAQAAVRVQRAQPESAAQWELRSRALLDRPVRLSVVAAACSVEAPSAVVA
jgi:hypothetical protein